MALKKLWQWVPPDALNFLLQRNTVRKVVLRKAERELYKDFVLLNRENRPPRVQEGRCLMLTNLLHSVDRAIADGRLSPKVSREIISNFAGRVLMQESDLTRNFAKRHGFDPPAFLTISPTKKCNLLCKGCYASSSSGSAETLPFSVVNRIIREKTELWGSYFTVISGGEPLLYQSEGKNFFDILEQNRDNYFMMYTNSTLITEEVARRMADLGNITPAISVEGFEAETDERRGKGVYKRIRKAMDNLRKAGVPFGVSVTATRHNAELVVSDEFIDNYFSKEGAIYGWIFQYMPIGRSFTTELMLTSAQRLAMFRKEEEIIKKHNLFMVDFWNGGPYSVGCISAGRAGGYFYIDWNGNISPCVFFPYYIANVYDVYRENKTLNDVLLSPFFSSIRSWQNGYGYTQPPDKVENLIVPCVIRDHYEKAYTFINEFGAKPMDENAAQALEDAEYRRKMTEYGRDVKSMTQGYWESEFMGPLS
ncbi:MAG: radical SAM protein [Nitrospirae bacterium]|nr:radical SAM protein [Nitrospirota bacterium]